jgi:hypothetical protein
MLGRWWQERLDQRPFSIGQIGFVTQANAAVLPSSGWGPHRSSRKASTPSRNHFSAGCSTLFGTGTEEVVAKLRHMNILV